MKPRAVVLSVLASLVTLVAGWASWFLPLAQEAKLAAAGSVTISGGAKSTPSPSATPGASAGSASGTGATSGTSSGASASTGTAAGGTSSGGAANGTGSSSATGTNSAGGSGTTSGASSGSSRYKDGTFTGSAYNAGHYGALQVSVTVASGKITAVATPQYPSRDGRSLDINQQALPMLIQEVIDAQSADISYIGGATYSSDAFIASLTSALSQAKA